MESPVSRFDRCAGSEEAVLPAPGVCAHALMSITSVRPTQFIDITDRIGAVVAATRVSQGLVNVQALHTTTGILLNEHEPLLLADFEATLSRVAPADALYRHDDPHLRVVNLTAEERRNGHAHCRALLLAPSASVNIVDGRLMLGRWQRVFFVELDGPRERVVSTLVLGEGSARR